MDPKEESLFPSSNSPPSLSHPPWSESDTKISALITPGSSSSNTIQPNSSPLSSSQPFPLSMSSLPFPSPYIDLESIDNLGRLPNSDIPEFKEFATVENVFGGGDGAKITDGGEEENLGVPQPLGCLHDNPIPPFLSKTFDLVDDPGLDPIISWGSNGESFVVWDPMEFARQILPRNFKHNNFSSFVRQLNTYGFRKIDTDRWEFANEGFLRGKRHMLKNIHRRKAPQTQPTGIFSGSSSEAGKFGLDGEIERLRKQKSLMMQEVVELQQQHRGTMEQMEVVNEKLQAAEQRQKQMVSFLAKLFQNPQFLARLQRNKEGGSISSPRIMRKFVKHHQQGSRKPSLVTEGKIIKHQSDLGNLTRYSINELNPDIANPFPDYFSQDLGCMGLRESMPFVNENIVPDELAVTSGRLQNPEQFGEGVSSLGNEDPFSKGKGKVSHQEGTNPKHFVSFPEDLAKEKNFQEFHSPGIESMVKQEDLWSIGLEASGGMPSPSNELWGNLSNYYMPELGVTTSFPDIWDLGSLQVTGGSGIERWPEEDSPCHELESRVNQPKEDSSRGSDE